MIHLIITARRILLQDQPSNSIQFCHFFSISSSKQCFRYFFLAFQKFIAHQRRGPRES